MIVAYTDRTGTLRCHLCQQEAPAQASPFREVHHDSAPHCDEPCDVCGLPVNHSRGHLCFCDEWEFLHDGAGDLYRAPRRNVLSLDGWRMGARFECTARQDQHRQFLADAYGIEL